MDTGYDVIDYANLVKVSRRSECYVETIWIRGDYQTIKEKNHLLFVD